VKLSPASGALAAILALMVGVVAAGAQGTVPKALVVPLGYCQLTSLSSATKLSSCNGGIPAGATMAVVRTEGANVRYRDDGGVPRRPSVSRS
jgi:hypothetical protein